MAGKKKDGRKKGSKKKELKKTVIGKPVAEQTVDTVDPEVEVQAVSQKEPVFEYARKHMKHIEIGVPTTYVQDGHLFSAGYHYIGEAPKEKIVNAQGAAEVRVSLRERRAASSAGTRAADKLQSAALDERRENAAARQAEESDA